MRFSFKSENKLFVWVCGQRNRKMQGVYETTKVGKMKVKRFFFCEELDERVTKTSIPKQTTRYTVKAQKTSSVGHLMWAFSHVTSNNACMYIFYVLK